MAGATAQACAVIADNLLNQVSESSNPIALAQIGTVFEATAGIAEQEAATAPPEVAVVLNAAAENAHIVAYLAYQTAEHIAPSLRYGGERET